MERITNQIKLNRAFAAALLVQEDLRLNQDFHSSINCYGGGEDVHCKDGSSRGIPEILGLGHKL